MCASTTRVELSHLADERGSIISLTDSSGNLIAINRYDEYGKPQSTNSGRFQYTGQKWIGEINAYDYKARDYLPHLGIFAQTDPAGYGDGPNWYAYAHNDPVNGSDPNGLEVSFPGFSGGWVCSGEGCTTSPNKDNYWNSPLTNWDTPSNTGGGSGTGNGGASGILPPLDPKIQACIDDISKCLINASLPGTSIGPIPTDPYGFHFVGQGFVGDDNNRTYPLLPGDTKLLVTAYSPNMVAEGGLEHWLGVIIPGGDFLLRFEDSVGHHRNSDFVFAIPGRTGIVPIPSGADRLQVVGTDNTPDETHYFLKAK